MLILSDSRLFISIAYEYIRLNYMNPQGSAFFGSWLTFAPHEKQKRLFAYKTTIWGEVISEGSVPVAQCIIFKLNNVCK